MQLSKVLSNMVLLFAFFASNTVHSQTAKKIIVEHFTNSNCSTCASRNPGLYSNLNNHPDVLHLAVHPSSPYSNCLLYQQNASDNDARTNYYGIYGSTPRIVVSGNVVSAATNYSSASIFTSYLSQTSPASIRIEQEKINGQTINVKVIIKTEEAHSQGALSLFVALAEDSVFHTGTNGEQIHFDVFRESLSSVTGVDVTLPATVGDSLEFNFTTSVNSVWNVSRIFALAILQEKSSKNGVQAAAASPNEGIISTGIFSVNNSLEVKIFPNPAQQNIFIEWENINPMQVALYDLQGKIVYKKQQQSSPLHVNLSTVPHGVYMLRLSNGQSSYQSKVVLQS